MNVTFAYPDPTPTHTAEPLKAIAGQRHHGIARIDTVGDERPSGKISGEQPGATPYFQDARALG